MKIISLLVFFTISIFAQDDFIIKHFTGKWKLITDNTEYYEEWVFISKIELAGIAYNYIEGESVIRENLYLKKFADQWAYIAMPVNQSITLFALTEYSETKFIFENKEHDFPQKIIYEFTSDNNLKAAIEGVVEGKMKRREFNFKRIH
jgi:hypothetical protein